MVSFPSQFFYWPLTYIRSKLSKQVPKDAAARQGQGPRAHIPGSQQPPLLKVQLLARPRERPVEAALDEPPMGMRLARVATAVAAASAPGGTPILALRGRGRAGPGHRAQMPTSTSTSAARRPRPPWAVLATDRLLHAPCCCRRRARRQEKQHAVEALLRQRALAALLLAPEEEAADGGAQVAPVVPARDGKDVRAQLPEAAPSADLYCSC